MGIDRISGRLQGIDLSFYQALKYKHNAPGDFVQAYVTAHTVSKGLDIREHHCPECGYQTHRDHAAAEMILRRGLENVITRGLWGTETACQVGLSGVCDLDKWRWAGMPNCEVGKPALYP
jgi:predicted metalloprotease